MAFKPKKKTTVPEPSKVPVPEDKGVTAGRRPGITFSMAYKGIKVGGDEFHPEKIDFFLSKTVDYIHGETPEETKVRVEATDELVTIVEDNVSATLGKKVKLIKASLEAQRQRALQDT